MSKKYNSVWDALEPSPILRDNLELRSKLLTIISQQILATGENQKAIAKTLGITQPRVSEIMRGKINRFSVDSLLELACKLGIKVSINCEIDDSVAA